MSELKVAADIKVGDKLLGWAASEDVRSRGASGGLVTAVLAAALETGLVDRVLVLKKVSEFEAYPVFTSDVQEVLESAGSMHSVPVNLARYLKPETCSGKQPCQRSPAMQGQSLRGRKGMSCPLRILM